MDNLVEKTESYARQIGADYNIARFGSRSYPLFYGAGLL